MSTPSKTQTSANAWSQLGANYAASDVHKHGPSLVKLLHLARPQMTDICLDVGTGAGHTAAALAPFVRRVVALDPARGMLEAARAAYGHLPNLEFVEATSEQTGLVDATFDIVTARHTLHHHPDMVKTLCEIRRILKSGGRFVMVDEITPDPQVDAWYHQLEVTRDPTHHRAYTMTEWQAFIAQAGLSWIVGDDRTRYSIDIPSWINRMNPSPEQAEAVREVFRMAPERARQTFNIAYTNCEAISVEMPMAVILAVKP